FASHSSRNRKGGCMQSEPSKSRQQSLEERAVALLSQDVDRLSRATQSCIPAGDLSQARENLAVLESRLHEVEKLLREIDQSDSQPSDPTEEHGAPPESQKRDDRVCRAPLPSRLAVSVAMLPLPTKAVPGVGPTISPGRRRLSTRPQLSFTFRSPIR